MLTTEQDLHTIKYIIRNNNSWVSDNQNLVEIDDIDSFLSSNTQFVRVSAYVILNLSYVEGYVPNGIGGCFMVTSGMKFEVIRKYISQVRAAYKKFTSKKHANTTTKSKWISKVRSDSERLSEVNIENIKYLERKGTLTTIHYIDGSTRNFYETLKYFEKIFDKNPTLVRIRRNCIINISFIENYQLNSATKTAKIGIDSQELHISRRKLPEFKRRRKAV